MTQGPGPSAPEQANYEFTEPQNKTVTELAGAMSFVGIFCLVLGILSLLVGVIAIVAGLASHTGHLATGVQALANGGIYMLMGLWIRRSSGAFTNIVKTQGSDISNLMSALQELTKTFSLARILMILYLVIMLLGFTAGFLLAAMGKTHVAPAPAAPAMSAPSK